jgi:hypothetical protein
MRDLPRGTQETRPGVGSLSRAGLSPSVAGLSRPLLLANPICHSLRDPQLSPVGPTTPRLQRLRPVTQPRFGLLRFRSPLLTEYSLLLQVLRCFSSLGVLARAMDSRRASPGITPGGFPHSDTSGSTLARSSPKHFVACHVLLRLLAPRHPPHALRSLTYTFTRLARCWPMPNVMVASEFPRRNRCFHSSVVKVAHSGALAARARCKGRQSASAFRAAPATGIVTAPAIVR